MSRRTLAPGCYQITGDPEARNSGLKLIEEPMASLPLRKLGPSDEPDRPTHAAQLSRLRTSHARWYSKWRRRLRQLEKEAGLDNLSN